MIYKYFLAVLTVFFLSGCGGGGEDLSANMDGSADGSSGGTTTNQSAEGLWSGVITNRGATDGMPSAGIVLSSGDYYFATGTNYTSLIVGKGNTSGYTFNSTNAYSPDNAVGFTEGTITGAVTTQKQLKPELKNTAGNNVASGELNYLTSYNKTPDLALLYGYKYSNVANSGKTFNLEKKDEGKFEFLYGDCFYSGTLATITDSKNYYALSLGIADKPFTKCSNATEKNNPIKGYAFIKESSDKNLYLYLIGININNSSWFSGAFKQTPL